MGWAQHSLPLAIVLGILLGAMSVPVATVDTAAQQLQPETDNTVTRIEIEPDGAAVWTVRIRTRLDSQEAVEDYEAFQDRFNNDTSAYLDPFRERMQRVVAKAANVTGREMRAENFSADTTVQEVPRRWGVVSFQFTWTNFALRTDGRLIVGDVFDGGFFLAENDSLVITAPAGYEPSQVEPTPSDRDQRSVTWVGREDFADQRPLVEFAQSTTDGSADGSVSTPWSSVRLGEDQALVGVLVLALIGLGAYGVHRWWQRSGEQSGRVNGQGSASGEPQGAPVLTDEERVRELLEARGQRLRQSEIGDELGWSPSKTSRVIGAMVESGTVEKLQLGRENLIEIADEE